MKKEKLPCSFRIGELSFVLSIYWDKCRNIYYNLYSLLYNVKFVKIIHIVYYFSKILLLFLYIGCIIRTEKIMTQYDILYIYAKNGYFNQKEKFSNFVHFHQLAVCVYFQATQDVR